MNEKIKEVIKGCLRKDPDKRMTLAEIRVFVHNFRADMLKQFDIVERVDHGRWDV